MVNAFNWTCPTCGAHTAITPPNVDRRAVDFAADNTPGGMGIKLTGELIECPNPRCRAQAFSVSVFHAKKQKDPYYRLGPGDPERPVGIGAFTFLPTTTHPLSSHVPKQVAGDYSEAFLIKTLSPKASATLARRALQGMVRDFFDVQDKPNLHQELLAIKDECDPALYEAIMGVKSVGNIGAHSEKDINLIVDVEPDEADILLQLIHLLDNEWYVARAERSLRIAKMKALASSKDAARSGGSVPSAGA